MHAMQKVSNEKAKQFVCDCETMKVTLNGMSITVNVVVTNLYSRIAKQVNHGKSFHLSLQSLTIPSRNCIAICSVCKILLQRTQSRELI